MSDYLKAGEYTTENGRYQTEVDLNPLVETEIDTYYILKDENGDESIVPVSKIQEELGYSTGYSSTAALNNTGTDTIGGRGKKLKKKKKPTVIRRNT